MSRDETLAILGILKAAYPYFYHNMKSAEAEKVVALWAEMFEHDDINIVKLAVKQLIQTHTDFPPNIAHVKQQIKAIYDTANNTPTREDMFNLLARAASNGNYHAKEEYEKLPEPVKRWCGSPDKLRELAMLDSDVFNTVVKGQFLKQIDIEISRQEYRQSIPPNVMKLIANAGKNLNSELDRLGAADDSV